MPCLGIPKNGKGSDYKRIDFVAKAEGVHFALEMKWTQTKPGPLAAKDMLKLQERKTPAAYERPRLLLPAICLQEMIRVPERRYN